MKYKLVITYLKIQNIIHFIRHYLKILLKNNSFYLYIFLLYLMDLIRKPLMVYKYLRKTILLALNLWQLTFLLTHLFFSKIISLKLTFKDSPSLLFTKIDILFFIFLLIVFLLIEMIHLIYLPKTIFKLSFLILLLISHTFFCLYNIFPISESFSKYFILSKFINLI